MVINRRGLSNARIAMVAFTALLVTTAYFLCDVMNKDDALWSPPTPTSSVVLNKAVPHNNSKRFSNSIELNVQRGLNIINTLSGQQMAAWIYVGRDGVPSNFHTWKNDPQEKMLYHPKDAAKMKDADTIWVSSSASAKLYEFATDFLPYINTTFALITTPFLVMPRNMELIAPSIVSHHYLLGWFATNIGKYTGGHHFHPKVFPFPLGLKPKMGAKKFQNPVKYYRDSFLELWNETNKNETELQAMYKTTDIFAGQISETIAGRKGIPSGRRLDYPEYLRHLAKAKYVLSPDGLHPDCHRHYESIGLGAIPITQLDPFLYSHLKEGPVVYQNDNWDIGQLRSTLPMDSQSPTRQMINRNLIFEEYWMEYVESATGKRLRWWDLTQKKQITLDMFHV